MCAAGGGGGPERACRKHASRGQNLQGAESRTIAGTTFLFSRRRYIADTSGFEPELPRGAVPKAAAEARAAREAAAREQAAEGGILPTVSSV